MRGEESLKLSTQKVELEVIHLTRIDRVTVSSVREGSEVNELITKGMRCFSLPISFWLASLVTARNEVSVRAVV